MSQLTQDEVQEKIDLTPEQQKAFAALERAVEKCRKLNIHFYQVLDSVGGVNGNNVYTIRCDADKGLSDVPEGVWDESRNFNNGLSYPYFRLTDGFADDPHYVQLRGD